MSYDDDKFDNREFLQPDHDEEEYGEVQRPGAYGPRFDVAMSRESDPPGATPGYILDATVVVQAAGNDGVHTHRVDQRWAVFATTSDGRFLRAMRAGDNSGWFVSVFDSAEIGYAADVFTNRVRSAWNESLAVALTLAGCSDTEEVS